MNEMVERVARALCIANKGDPDAMLTTLADENVKQAHWRFWEPHARAAIAAMREPTEGMSQAAFDLVLTPGFRPAPSAQWRAMIDEALK